MGGLRIEKDLGGGVWFAFLKKREDFTRRMSGREVRSNAKSLSAKALSTRVGNRAESRGGAGVVWPRAGMSKCWRDLLALE